MIPLEQVRPHERPSRVLFTVYLVRAIGGAIGVFIAIGFIVLRVGGAAAFSKASEAADKAGVPVLAIASLGFLVVYAIVALALYVRFRTLRYRWDEDGVTRIWGLLFRRESFVAYKRIQDAQVTQGIVERAFGIGTVAIQTASATQGAAETIEGMREFKLIREFLYERMRGVSAVPAATGPALAPELALVGEIRDEMRALRMAVERRR
ncbi:MAG TPA: PH domain-containing protein [Planctomycetota bacterium]|nr:PH domain-containing protein [Planctomycetota bacterium]